MKFKIAALSVWRFKYLSGHHPILFHDVLIKAACHELRISFCGKYRIMRVAKFDLVFLESPNLGGEQGPVVAGRAAGFRLSGQWQRAGRHGIGSGVTIA